MKLGTFGRATAAGPINRETYRVLGTRDDGGLLGVPLIGRDHAGADVLGKHITLPERSAALTR